MSIVLRTLSIVVRSLLVLMVAVAIASGVRSAWADDGGVVAGTVTARPSKFLPDTIVYLKKAGAAGPHRTVTIDQTGMAFVPHIVTIAVGDQVSFQNHDAVAHNVMSPTGKYDLGNWGKGHVSSHTFPKAGVFAQLCKLHPEMLAYVFVGQNRYAAIVDASGKFSIAGVPAGTYEVDIWNPHLKAAGQQLTVTNGATTSATFALKR